MTLMHPPLAAPSGWITRWAHLVRPGGRVLDLACGSGRHAGWFAARGYAVLAVDRDADAVAGLPATVTGRVADLEQGDWPLGDAGLFDAIVVAKYLHRPLWPLLSEALAPGGVLLYETFASGNETVGKPSRPDFLLQPGELLEVARTRGLRVIGYEDGFLEVPKTAFVQRLCAVREVPETAAGSAPSRYRLPA
jgi:SAM-dependent methyltransferase